MLEPFAALLIEGRLRRHPEGGARRGVLRRAARNRSPREAREVARQALRPGCEELAARIRRQCRRRKRGPGSPKSPRWSAERRASRVMGRKAPRKRLVRRGESAFTRVFHALWRASRVFRRAPERLSALRPPLDSGWRSKVAKPGRRHAPREREDLGCLKSE